MKLVLVFLLAAGTAVGQVSAAGDHPAQAVDPLAKQKQAATEALEAQDWRKAMQLLTPIAEADPKDAHVLYDLGSAEDALDRTSEAETSYRAAIADDGKMLEPRVALGLLLARNGKMDDARTELAAAAALGGEKALAARALRALARIDQKDRPAESRDELLAASSLSSETPEDKLMAAELAEAAGNGKGAAEAQYRKVLAEDPNDAQAVSELAHLLAGEKKYAEAEKLLVDGLAAHPGDPGMTIQLASVYSADGQRAQALPLVESLHRADPGEAHVARLLAELYSDAKDYEKAEPLLAGLCAQNPRDGELADLQGVALMHLHRPVEAEAVLRRVVAEPTVFSTQEAWAQAAADLAFSASENNEPDTVLQILRERANVLPPSPPILFLTAISEDRLRQTKLAIQAYKDFLTASNGALPNEEFEARHRLVALEHRK